MKNEALKEKKTKIIFIESRKKVWNKTTKKTYACSFALKTLRSKHAVEFLCGWIRSILNLRACTNTELFTLFNVWKTITSRIVRARRQRSSERRKKKEKKRLGKALRAVSGENIHNNRRLRSSHSTLDDRWRRLNARVLENKKKSRVFFGRFRRTLVGCFRIAKCLLKNSCVSLGLVR